MATEIEVAATTAAAIGDLRGMPGLPDNPAVEHIDLDDNGEVIGLM